MDLTAKIAAELRNIRKRRGGISVSGMTDCPALVQILGAGDARVALNGIKHAVLSMDQDLATSAVSYSLGFASEHDAHLDRLTEFGQTYGYDQRQARRYSDKGINRLAALIREQFVLDASPILDIGIRPAVQPIEAIGAAAQSGDTVDDRTLKTAEISILLHRPEIIEMRHPVVEIVELDGKRERQTCQVIPMELDCHPTWEHQILLIEAMEVRLTGSQVLSVLWRGEVYPKFSVRVEGDGGVVECLGSRVQVGVG